MIKVWRIENGTHYVNQTLRPKVTFVDLNSDTQDQMLEFSSECQIYIQCINLCLFSFVREDSTVSKLQYAFAGH